MEEYTLTKEYLDEVMDAGARALVGRVMKRFEIIRDKEEIKKAVKELIYENHREVRELIKAFSLGVKFEAPKAKS